MAVMSHSCWVWLQEVLLMCDNRSVCRLCPRLVISQAVTFADGTLTINLPAGSYEACKKYCIVVAQAIPEETTIIAPVAVTIGDGTQTYPLTNRSGAQMTAQLIRSRTRYATVVSTTANGGAFRLLGKLSCCTPVSNNLTTIYGGAAAAEGGGA